MAAYIQACFFIVSIAFGLIAGDGRFSNPDEGPQTDFLLRAWIWPSFSDAVIMLGLGVLNATGVYLISQGYRLSEAGLVAPFEYTALPLAILWGVLLWGDWPNSADWIGIGLICGAGLCVLYRESAFGRTILPRDAWTIPRARMLGRASRTCTEHMRRRRDDPDAAEVTLAGTVLVTTGFNWEPGMAPCYLA